MHSDAFISLAHHIVWPHNLLSVSTNFFMNKKMEKRTRRGSIEKLVSKKKNGGGEKLNIFKCKKNRF